MTGTSIDGLDCALVAIEGDGPAMRARVVEFAERPLGALREGLRRMADQGAMTAGDVARLALAFGELHAEAVADLLKGRRADLVAVHGQTVFHAPPASWQLINPWPIAARVGLPVVFDLRGADLAAGGQGAPITPIADWVLFRDATPRAIVNLGGFCNITLLPPTSGEAAPESAKTRMMEQVERIRGFDVCACNHVLDLVARRALGRAFDEDGAAAMRGTPHADAANDLRDRLARQATSGRSLGTGDEAAAWVEAWQPRLKGDDLAATATEGVARAIAARLPADAEIVVAGGGARNRALLRRLGTAAARSLRATDELGIPTQAREAACIAVLGALAQDRVPLTLRGATTRGERCAAAGAWIAT